MEPITREWLAGPNLDRMYEAAVKSVKQVLKEAEVGRNVLSAHVQGSNYGALQRRSRSSLPDSFCC